MSFESKLEEQEGEIEKAITVVFDFAHATGDDKAQMIPMFHLVDANWNGHVVGTQMGDPLDKDLVAEWIRQYCGTLGAILAVWASEVWMRTATEDEEDPLQAGVADHPDKTEALVITFDSAVRTRVVIYQILRDRGRARLGTRKEVDDIQAGRFTNFVRKID